MLGWRIVLRIRRRGGRVCVIGLIIGVWRGRWRMRRLMRFMRELEGRWLRSWVWSWGEGFCSKGKGGVYYCSSMLNTQFTLSFLPFLHIFCLSISHKNPQSLKLLLHGATFYFSTHFTASPGCLSLNFLNIHCIPGILEASVLPSIPSFTNQLKLNSVCRLSYSAIWLLFPSA